MAGRGSAEPPVCTCLCATYVDVVNKLMFFLGLILLLFVSWMVFSDPISDQSLKDLAHVGKAKWAFLIAGLLVMCTACLGIKFVDTRSRRLGCAYLLCVLIAVVLLLIIAREMSQKVAENITIENDDFDAAVDDGKKAVYRKAFDSWASRFNNPEKESQDMGCDYDESEVSVSGRRLVHEDAWKTSEGSDGKCSPHKKEIRCNADKATAVEFARNVNGFCFGSGEAEDPFTHHCKACVDEWWAEFGFDDNADTLKTKFNGKPGAIYCRCASAVLVYTQKHSGNIKICALAFAGLLVVLMGSTVWLVLCGPSSSSGSSPEDMGDPIQLGEQQGRNAPRMQLVTCPAGAQPGSMVMVNTEDGRMMQAMVPPGIYPGMQFQVAS